MTNLALFNEMISKYNQLAFTHDYIFGFEFMGNIYMVETTSEILPYVLKLDKASRGAGYSLRFKPNKSQKVLLMGKNTRILCSKEYFQDMVKDSKYNRGEIFEKLVTEFFGQEWEKDNIPFTDDGDITVNGKSFQIKFQSATFTNEKTLAKLMA